VALLWICIGFNADPDPAFYPNADPDQDSGSQTNAYPDPCQTLKSQKVEYQSFGGRMPLLLFIFHIL
jgi:hypothetical protein